MADLTLEGGNFKLPAGMTSFTAILFEFRPTMNEVAFLVQDRMADYPPKPAGSKYIRTGNLGRKWTNKVTMTPNELMAIIGNNTSYAPWVQNYLFQAKQNRHWQTDKQVLEELEPSIVSLFQAKINSLFT